jgi:hypothetical protein
MKIVFVLSEFGFLQFQLFRNQTRVEAVGHFQHEI